MSHKSFSDGDIAMLTTELQQQGCVVSSSVDMVASGFFGDCFVFDSTIIKLFRKISADEVFFKKSLIAYEQLAQVADQITRCGITLPQLIGFGHFSPAIQIGGQAYYAWQHMTRVNGQPLKQEKGTSVRHTRLDDRLVMEMATVAAKFHVRIDPTDQPVKANSFLSHFTKIKIEPNIVMVVNELERYIAANTSSTDAAVLLHGDFKPSHILKDAKAGYGVIDWDLQSFGRAEHDLWFSFSFSQPQALRGHPTKNLCDAYNGIATEPIKEGLLVAFGLSQLLRSYYHQLNDPKNRMSPLKRGEIVSDIAPRIVGVAQRMHQLTGKQIYANAQKHFSEVTHRINKPLRHAANFPKKTLTQKVFS